MVVRWSDFARGNLRNIYDYYLTVASITVANRLIDKIVKRVDALHHSPFIGQREWLLNDFPQDFRYLVEGNYKIIYFVDDDTVTIVSVFDCRQNPEAITNFN